MRYTPISLMLSAAALLSCSVASAQTLLIDSIQTNLLNIQNQASVTIDPLSGNVVVRSATGSACTVTPAPTVSVTGPSSGQVNSQVSVSWTSTNTSGATPCTPSSNPINNTWNTGASAPNGNRTVTLPASAGTQTLTMTCSGSTSPAGSSTLSINVTSTVLPPECTGTPTDGLIISANPGSWTTVFPGSTFPNPYGNAKAVIIPQGMSAAIAFNSGSGTVSPIGAIETAEQSGQPAGPLRISFSKCPGDFRPQLRVGQLCATTGGSNQASMVFRVGSIVGSGYCTLTPNTNYYFNITHRVPANPDEGIPQSECAGASCTTLMTTRELLLREMEELDIDLH